MTLSVEEFKYIVVKDVKKTASLEETEQLHSDMWAWIRYLNSFKRDIEIQFAAQKVRLIAARANTDEYPTEEAYNQFLADEQNWKVKSIRLLASVEDKIAEVKGLIRDDHYNELAA